MRRLSLLFLIAILILNVFGFYIAFMVKQDAVKKEMAELLEQHEKKTRPFITLNKVQFESVAWVTEGKEFRHNGKLYDVAEIEFTQDAVNIFVEEDSLEANLIADFVSILNRQTEREQSNSPLKLLLEHFLKDFTIEKAISFFQPNTSSIEVPIKDLIFTSFISGLQSPPPDWA